MRVIHTKSISLVIAEQNQTPAIVYIGRRLEQPLSESSLTTLLQRAIPQGGLDEAAQLTIASSFADPTFLNPALQIHQQGKAWAPQWQLQENEATESSVRYKLADSKSGLVLSWHLIADAQNDVFTIETSLENKGSHNISLQQWLTTLPVPQRLDTITSFTGRWIHEFQPQQQSLSFGSVEFSNWKGRTSHDHFPGLLLGSQRTDFTHGECFAFHLGWSGNHQQRVERSQSGQCQYQAGIALMPGEVELAPGDQFCGAPLYFTYATNGFAGVAERFQPFVRDNILSFPNTNPRPVHINTWEALYFNHEQTELDSLAAAAEHCGVERYVLDDGWFSGRRDDTAGLGDWVVDESIYPNGLHPLKTTLKKHNLGFGLWFEPEMVNKNSQLYRSHPDWVLQLPGQQQVSGRNQWVLDITRPEVQDYLYQQITDILRDYPVEYIKWDMNRDLLQAGDQQGKPVYYHYVKSLYRLLDRIRKAYPHVEIESCASGGGRMDYGILKYTHRFWLSDCNDANERQIMQQWASLFFPAEVLGSHIGPTKSHTTSRSHALNVRAGTALFGHLGIEWDIRQANELEQAQLVQLVSLYKDLRNTLHQGIRRPMAGADKHQIAFSVTHNDTTLISIFQQKMPEFSVPASLQISGLDSDHHYAIDILIEAEHTGHLMKRKPSWMHNRTKVFSGEQLMQFGLPLPVMDPESLLVLKLTDC